MSRPTVVWRGSYQCWSTQFTESFDMLKRALLMSMLTLLLFISDMARGDTARSITVVSDGDGSTVEEAKGEAVRRALQQAFKQLIVVDRVVSGDKLLRDRVLSTSNGYVEKYEELSSSRDGDGFRVEARITLSASRIEHFLGIVESGGGQMDGSLFGAEIARRNATDAAVTAQGIARGEIFDRLFEQFPSGAAKVTLLQSRLSEPDGATLLLELGVTYHRDFVSSLTQTLEALSLESCSFNDTSGSLWLLNKGDPCLGRDGSSSDADEFRLLRRFMPKSSIFLSYGVACIHNPETSLTLSKCYILDHGAYFWSGRDPSKPEGVRSREIRFAFFGRFEDDDGRTALKSGDRCTELEHPGFNPDAAAERALGVVALRTVGSRYTTAATSGGLRGEYFGRGRFEDALGLNLSGGSFSVQVPASDVDLGRAKKMVAVVVSLHGKKSLNIMSPAHQSVDPCDLVDEASLRLRAGT